MLKKGLILVGMISCITATAFAQTPAGNVSAGTFGSNFGNGNFTFPAGLTVDTSTLVVDATNNRVGIGTATPTSALTVSGQSLFNILTPLLTGDQVVIQSGLSVQRGNGGVSGNAPNMTFTSSRGTDAAPTASGNGDETGRFLFRAYDGSATVSSARFGAVIDGTVSAGVAPQAITFKTGTTTANATERMRIDSAGNVGIGATAAAGKKLYVSGDAHVTGTLTGGNIAATYQDVAEWVPATTDLEPGTVVVLNPTHSNEVMASHTAYDTTVAGVVSAQPGIILGIGGDTKEQIATTGRVKVRVDANKGAIHIGDLLVTSDKPGTAMRSTPVEVQGVKFHQPGTVIGKALEPLANGEGTILVLLSLQ
ncbi:MAG TPA: hypothetical protein VFN10_04005 [Thermoanaerobaculia bacterium]|nr:hypothetical protein [Thermoanaerobaculia bacterium]